MKNDREFLSLVHPLIALHKRRNEEEVNGVSMWKCGRELGRGEGGAREHGRTQGTGGRQEGACANERH